MSPYVFLTPWKTAWWRFRAEKRPLSQELIDTLLQAVDLLGSIAQVSDEALESWEDEQSNRLRKRFCFLFLPKLRQSASTLPPKVDREPDAATARFHKTGRRFADRVLRVTAENLDRLMALAGEALVASRWLSSFATDTPAAEATAA